MSSILISRNAQSASPSWLAEELEALTNSPGDNAVEFMLDPFAQPAGWLCTQTAIAKIAGVGGTEAFSSKKTFSETTACRQAQSSICANGWAIEVSYDNTNGTRCYYTTDGSTWSSAITISSAVNAAHGEIWMPGLLMSQSIPGLAVVTAFKGINTAFGGSNATPAVGGTWRRQFDINSTNGLMGWTLGNGTLSANGINLTGTSPNFQAGIGGTLTLPAGTTVTAMWLHGCSNPFRTANCVGQLTAAGTIYQVSYGAMGPNCNGTVIKSGLSVTTSGSYGFMYYDQLNATSYAKLFNIEGTGTNPFGAATTAAAYVTQDYGATWTEITNASIVGYIQPGKYLSGAIEAPYTDASPQRLVYGTVDDSGAYIVPNLKRVSGTTVTDISPVANGKTYGVPYNKGSRRAIAISVKDANTAILCGESRNAGTGTSTYRVFLTRNLWDTTPTWTALTDESATLLWRGVYLAGDTANVAYFLGTNGNYGYWSTSNPTTIYDRKGDSAKSVNTVGLCGL